MDVRPCFIDESALPGETAEAMTLRLCREKAEACSPGNHSVKVIIAADTLVAIDHEALGQPKDLAQARVMIQKLAGKTHQVHTGVCVRVGDMYKTDMVTTKVHFRNISDAEIDIYLQHNDILDKAGAYAIQGGASSFITAIEGSLDNVIGLPVLATQALIEAATRDAALQGAEMGEEKI